MKTISVNDKDFLCDIHTPCFAELGPEELELVRNSKTQVIFHKGETVIKQGAFASYVLFINGGLCKQYLEAEGARNLNLRLIGAGEFAGLSAVFSDKKFSYSLTALSETRVFLIETDTTAQLAQQNAGFSFRITQRYCRENMRLFHNMHQLVYKHLHGRMADVLLYIDHFRLRDPEVFSLLSRKDIAEFAGMSTESAVKILKGFEKDGWVELEEKDIRIMRREKLEEVAERG